MEEFNKMNEALKKIVEIMDGLEIEEMKQVVLCTLFDVLFEEKSVEVAKECLKYMEEVNEELGAYKKES